VGEFTLPIIIGRPGEVNLLLRPRAPRDQVHAPNEKFNLTSFHGATKSVGYLYEELGSEQARFHS